MNDENIVASAWVMRLQYFKSFNMFSASAVTQQYKDPHEQRDGDTNHTKGRNDQSITSKERQQYVGL